MAFNITYKIKTDGEITFYREVLRIHCISKGISLSERELYILAFFVSEGYNRISKDKLIETNYFSLRSFAAFAPLREFFLYSI